MSAKIRILLLFDVLSLLGQLPLSTDSTEYPILIAEISPHVSMSDVIVIEYPQITQYLILN